MMAVPETTYVNPNDNTTCGVPRYDSWQMLRSPVGSDIPWPGFLFGQTPASIWYWCADQMMVQKALSAKSLSDAQGATILTGWIKVLPMFLIVIPGMISRVLYPDEVGSQTTYRDGHQLQDLGFVYLQKYSLCLGSGNTQQSLIIGKRLRETAPAGRAKLQREFRVPISNNYARLNIAEGA